jgi:hypothetical protein
MRIAPTFGGSISAPRRGTAADVRRVEPGERSAAGGEEHAGSRALVPTEPPARIEAPARIVRHRVDAAFLAQLSAAIERGGATGRAERIEPRRGAAAYARVERGEGLLTPGYLVDVVR